MRTRGELHKPAGPRAVPNHEGHVPATGAVTGEPGKAQAASTPRGSKGYCISTRNSLGRGVRAFSGARSGRDQVSIPT
jgi:hypothetical protein